MRQEPTHSRSQDLLGTILGSFCAIMLILAPWQIDLDVPYPFYKGPLLMPVIALLLGTLASLPSVFRLLFRHTAEKTWSLDGEGWPAKPCAMFLTTLLFPLGIITAGLELATIVVLAIELYITGSRNPKILLGIPFAVSVLFWIVFKALLDVYFPEPLILSMLP
jgi:hypothetical protein